MDGLFVCMSQLLAKVYLKNKYKCAPIIKVIHSEMVTKL